MYIYHFKANNTHLKIEKDILKTKTEVPTIVNEIVFNTKISKKHYNNNIGKKNKQINKIHWLIAFLIIR